MTLGKTITDMRQARGFTKAQLARRVGVSDVSISYWEAGSIKQVGHERLLALAEALGCTVSDLVGDPKMREMRALIDRMRDYLKEPGSEEDRRRLIQDADMLIGPAN